MNIENQNTLYEYILSAAEKYPNNTAYDFMGSKKTYSEFINQIKCAAAALKGLGIKTGDVICIAMPNTPQAIILFYAANSIGAVVNMIHPLSSRNEFKTFVNRVNAKLLLIMDQFYPVFEPIENETCLEHIIAASVADALTPIRKIAYRFTAGKDIKQPRRSSRVLLWNDFISKKDSQDTYTVFDKADEMALILHSGGTTGKVKGVCLSNDQVNQSALQMMKANPMLQAGDKFLSVMPIFHGNGLVIGIHAILMLGGTCVLIPRFTPETYAKDLLKHKCNYMSGVPALFERLMKVDVMKNADLSFLKGVFSGADYLSVEVENRINEFLDSHKAKVHVRQGYGMTEGVVATTLNPWDEQRKGSIGKALDGVNVKIVKPGTDEELDDGQVGEIVFSSATNMMCYYNDPEETANVLRTHSDGSRWIHSGDLGCRDKDGYFFFKGRIKRMIVTNGYNVYPNELESIIEGFDMVDRCCVIGVGAEGAQKIKAVVSLKKPYTKSPEVQESIMDLCRGSIAKYALPKSIEFVDSMPTTKVGKVDYTLLKTMFEKN